MAGDWVKTYRKMLASEVFLDSDPYLLKLWIYCLLKANWKPKPFSGVMIPIGSFAFVSRNLAGALGVSRGKLWRDIEKLEEMEQIETQTNRNFTVVSICNWETYQDTEEDERDTNGPQTKSGHKRTTKRNEIGTQTDHDSTNANTDINETYGNNADNERDKDWTQTDHKSRQKCAANGTTNKEVKKVRSKEQSKSAAAPLSVPIPENLNTTAFKEVLEEFRQMRVEIKKPMTPTAEKALLKKLAAWGIEVAIVALEKSTESQWQGVFKPKPEDMPAVVVSRVATDEELLNWSPD